MSQFSPEEPSSVKEKDKDGAPRPQSLVHGNNIVCINNKQSSRGCWLEGRRLLRESP